MRELSLHILDIVQNSLAAGASLVSMFIHESPVQDFLRIEIIDNGQGIKPDQLNQVADPFYSTRETRKVGLGLSLLQAAAERSGGDFSIYSQPDKGTKVVATFKYYDIDRAPLGNIADTLLTLLITNPRVDFDYHHRFEGNLFAFDSREFSKEIPRSELSMPLIASQLGEYLTNAIQELYVKPEG